MIQCSTKDICTNHKGGRESDKKRGYYCTSLKRYLIKYFSNTSHIFSLALFVVETSPCVCGECSKITFVNIIIKHVQLCVVFCSSMYIPSTVRLMHLYHWKGDLFIGESCRVQSLCRMQLLICRFVWSLSVHSQWDTINPVLCKKDDSNVWKTLLFSKMCFIIRCCWSNSVNISCVDGLEHSAVTVTMEMEMACLSLRSFRNLVFLRRSLQLGYSVWGGGGGCLGVCVWTAWSPRIL